MKIAQRIVFYGIGFIIGIVLLMFFLGGKKTSCDYGPQARVLKNIKTKKRVFTMQSLQALYSQSMDTTAVTALLNEGSVVFSESTTDLDSCKIYVIDGEYANRYVKLEIENCEELATITKATFRRN